MEVDVVESLGERRFAHPSGTQHLDAVLVAQNARFPGPGAQSVGYFGGPPMGMHVDHGCFLNGSFGSLTPWRFAAKYDNWQYRSMAPADHVARRADLIRLIATPRLQNTWHHPSHSPATSPLPHAPPP